MIQVYIYCIIFMSSKICFEYTEEKKHVIYDNGRFVLAFQYLFTHNTNNQLILIVKEKNKK